ncbi:serine/arginine-rich splicing factor 6 isoform X2 [Patella vulgata]|uniref:serine/arginine-rich splicing factor 6 isoform X2 n=1 Tax=Patella vulgata TaxID=6465 RepID=UPI00217FDA9D|nr:serine/arginine-rich splicing factor 6 isoform X2 [Patella vulgata]
MVDGDLNIGVIIGIVIALLVVVLAVILVIIYCFVKVRRDEKGGVNVHNVEAPPSRADSSWSTKASSNYSASNTSQAQQHHDRDSSQEISSISSNDSVFGYNNVTYNPNGGDAKDRGKKVAYHKKHVYFNEGFESTTADSSTERIKYKKNEPRNGSLSRESRTGSKRRSRERNSVSDKPDKSDNVDATKSRGSGDRSSRPQDKQSSNGSLPRSSSGGHRSSGRSRSRSSGRRSQSGGRPGSHGRRSHYARSASSDGSSRNPKSSLPDDQRPSISSMYKNKAFRDDDDRSPSPDLERAVSSHPESQV